MLGGILGCEPSDSFGVSHGKLSIRDHKLNFYPPDTFLFRESGRHISQLANLILSVPRVLLCAKHIQRGWNVGPICKERKGRGVSLEPALTFRNLADLFHAMEGVNT